METVYTFLIAAAVISAIVGFVASVGVYGYDSLKNTKTKL